MNPIGVYIHIPFCAHKCAYCDFYSLANTDASGYAEAVIRQIKSHKSDFRGRFVDTVYIGGGTPSVIAPTEIAKILGVTPSTITSRLERARKHLRNRLEDAV